LKESELGHLKREIQFQDPKLFATMDKIDSDVRTAYVTASEMFTERGFQDVLAKKLSRISGEEQKRRTFQELIKSEIPNLDALDIKSIVKIRRRHNIDKLWKRVEDARERNREDFGSILSEMNSELWDLALKYVPVDSAREIGTITAKSVISNIPYLGTAIGVASDIKEIISNYHFSEHWGSVVLDLKKEALKRKSKK
jgi:hypothetical protein